MKIKRALCLVCAISLLFAFASPAFARWDHISSVAMNVTFSGNTASCTLSIDTYPVTDFLNVYWCLVEEDTGTVMNLKQKYVYDQNYIDLSQTTSPVVKGRTYRLNAAIHVYRNGYTETVIVDHTVKYT